MITIREFNFSESDFEAVLAIHNADSPDNPTTLENLKFGEESRNKEYLRQRFMVEKKIEGSNRVEAIAVCATWESSWSHVPGKYNVGFLIPPAHADSGIEEQAFEHLLNFLNQREPKPKYLDTFIREDRTTQVEFFQTNGFEVLMRENECSLDVTNFDFSRFDRAFEKAAANGIEIATLTELQSRYADWQQRMYDLFVTVDTDIPAPDALTPQPLEEFAKSFDNPNFLPDAHFIALDGDDWVGTSTLWKVANPQRMNVGITGTLRSHRRKGIATALKLKTIQYAIDYGAEKIHTGNEENNPMYDLNVMLGFEPLPAWLEMRKTLD